MTVIATSVVDHYDCSNKSQPHATSFGNITIEGQLVEEALLCVVQAPTNLSKSTKCMWFHFVKTLPCPFPMGRWHFTHWESDTCPFPPLLMKERTKWRGHIDTLWNYGGSLLPTSSFSFISIVSFSLSPL